jgi:hypothetical protein
MNADQIDNALHKVVAMGGAAVAANGGALPTTRDEAFMQIAGGIVAVAGFWLSHRHNASSPAIVLAAMPAPPAPAPAVIETVPSKNAPVVLCKPAT